MTIYHNHHIIPKHMGGSNEPSNLVCLTISEHALAHKKLYKKYNKIEDLWAYQLLSYQITHKEGFKKVLSKNAYDTHKKQKERNTGLYNSSLQSLKGKKGGKDAGAKSKFKNPETNPTFMRVNKPAIPIINLCTIIQSSL